MNCERVHEILSDYVEGALDPTVARRLEGHLLDCNPCRQESLDFRATWAELQAMPVVPPPPSLEDAVIAAIHRQTVAAHPVRAGSPWQQWLRGISPLRTAFATSIATLIVAGALVTPWVRGIYFGPISVAPQPEGTGLTSRNTAARGPVSVRIEYGPTVDGQSNVRLMIRCATLVRSARVAINRSGSTEFHPMGEGTMIAGKPYLLEVHLSPGWVTPERLEVSLTGEGGEFDEKFLCIVPPAPHRAPESVSATFVETPLSTVAVQMAAKVGAPVVIDSEIQDQPITHAMTGEPVALAWKGMLSPLGLQAVRDGNTYRITREE